MCDTFPQTQTVGNSDQGTMPTVIIHGQYQQLCPETVQGATLHKDRARLEQENTASAFGSQPREEPSRSTCFHRIGPISPFSDQKAVEGSARDANVELRGA